AAAMRNKKRRLSSVLDVAFRERLTGERDDFVRAGEYLLAARIGARDDLFLREGFMISLVAWVVAVYVAQLGLVVEKVEHAQILRGPRTELGRDLAAEFVVVRGVEHPALGRQAGQGTDQRLRREARAVTGDPGGDALAIDRPLGLGLGIEERFHRKRFHIE